MMTMMPAMIAGATRSSLLDPTAATAAMTRTAVSKVRRMTKKRTRRLHRLVSALIHPLADGAAAGLEQETHDINLPRRAPHGLFGAAERAGGEIERCNPEGERVYLRALPPQQRVDARAQLARVKGLCEIVIRSGVAPFHAVLQT